jgi:hypothetical protein
MNKDIKISSLVQTSDVIHTDMVSLFTISINKTHRQIPYPFEIACSSDETIHPIFFRKRQSTR